MKTMNILILGGGRSAKWLINKLAAEAKGDLRLTVADSSKPAFLQEGPYVHYLGIDAADEEELEDAIAGKQVCVSLLPPALHLEVAKVCLRHQVHFVSASYQSEEIKNLDDEAKEDGIVILSECGLDPGIDHVTALQALLRIKAEGGKVLKFQSHCGGLPAETHTNDWGYKFFWNPMNVVLAGADGAKLLQEGKEVIVPYSSIFAEANPLKMDGKPDGEYVWYPNRDSVAYIDHYRLEGMQDFVRGTIRSSRFCGFWAELVQMGMTNNVHHFGKQGGKERLADFVEQGKLERASSLAKRLLEEEIDGTNSTLASKLLKVLTKLWTPGPADLDTVLMVHKIGYETAGGEPRTYVFEMEEVGTNEASAMSHLVGLPIYLFIESLQAGHKYPSGSLTPSHESVQPVLFAGLLEAGLKMEELDFAS